MVLPKAGLTCFYDNLVLNQHTFFNSTFVLINPAFGNTQTLGAAYFFTPSKANTNGILFPK